MRFAPEGVVQYFEREHKTSSDRNLLLARPVNYIGSGALSSEEPKHDSGAGLCAHCTSETAPPLTFQVGARIPNLELGARTCLAPSEAMD